MATLLPNGKQQFCDDNGAPIAGGTVGFYIPNTLVAKDTWVDAGQTTLNANPIPLDAGGRAIIYGSGSYRQIVKKANGDLVWDQLTASTASGDVVFGGTSAGTANAQTITAAAFNGTDGSVLIFYAGLTNTGALTLTIGASAPIPIVRDSVTGPVALTGGEVVVGNAISLIYDTGRGAFHLIETVASSRSALTANRTYYVRSDGSNSNNGLTNSSSGAFQTIAHAVAVVIGSVDTAGFAVTIQCGAGTFTEQVFITAPITGGGSLTILGDTAAVNYDTVSVVGGFIALNGAQFFVRGFKISSTAAGTWSLYASGPGSCITWSHINFGAVTGGGDHMIATDHGTWINDGPYKITGGALNHYHVTEGGHGRVFAQNVVITGTPNFTGQFAGVAFGDLVVIDVFYTGAITGRAYLVHLNGVIRAQLDIRNVFPGNINGEERNGGRLDGAPMFAANKNSVNQTIANGGWVKITMGTLTQQVGGDYSAASSIWVPRAGCLLISATVTFSAINATNEICGISIFKNSVEYKSVLFNSTHTTNPQSATITFEDLCGGGDTYEVYARGGNTGSSIVNGAPTWSYWSGRQF